MIQFTPQSKILLATDPIDFRKGIDGISAICTNEFKKDPSLNTNDIKGHLMKHFKFISLMIAFNLTGFVFGAAAHNIDPELRQLRENTVTTLILGGNQIGDAGARALADALRGNTSLTVLDLRSNQIGAEGASALAGALIGNKSLTELYLYAS